MLVVAGVLGDRVGGLRPFLPRRLLPLLPLALDLGPLLLPREPLRAPVLRREAEEPVEGVPRDDVREGGAVLVDEDGDADLLLRDEDDEGREAVDVPAVLDPPEAPVGVW